MKQTNSLLTFCSSLRQLAGLFAVAALASVSARAQLIYSQNFDSDDSANWVVLQGSAFGSGAGGGEISLVNFNFDYSTIGIPSAPHSMGGTTKGLKLMADCNTNVQLGSVTGAGLSVSPTNFSISQNFDMHVDMWVNYNGPNISFIQGGTATNAFYTNGPNNPAIPGSGNGSGIFYGCGYGTAGLAAQIAGTADSVYVGTCVDNSSAAEMRMYGPSQTGSYQNGVYQISGTTTPAAGGDILVYNNTTGTRTFANLAPPNTWTNFFPATKPPLAQVNLYQQQTNIACFAGLIDFAWHDVEVQKIGNVIVYSIDGHIAATANTASAGNIAGGYLTFLAFDINGNASVDPNFTNLNFVVFDNIRVSNYVNVVTVQATTPNASEIGPAPGAFTISRTSPGVPLRVNYTLTGTATNGIQYATIPTNVTFASTDTSTNIIITPIDDGIPNVPTSVILTILPGGTNYTGAGADTVFIADADTPTIDITSSQPQMYERYTNDFITFTLTRRGRVTAPNTATLSYAGDAVAGTDYISTNNILLDTDVQSVNFQIFPIRNTAVSGNKTVTATVSAVSGGGAVGVATGNSATIVDADYPPASNVLTDPLSDGSPAETAKWAITYGTGDLLGHATDFNVDFGFDLTSAPNGAISPPPGGSTTALHITCNKANGAGGNAGAPGGVNVYYTNMALNGNYAVRFNMNLIEGHSGLSGFQHEGAIIGINHSGSYSNWWYAGGTNTSGDFSSDGFWYFVCSQFGGTLSGDYQEFTGLGGTNGNPGWTRLRADVAPNYTNVFKSPMPFTSLDDMLKQSGGVPGNASPFLGYDNSAWSDVEIKQLNDVITLSINHTVIFSTNNNTIWTNGYLMLGYGAPYGDGQNPESAVYYANLSVVQLQFATPVITNTVVGGGNVTLKFLASATDAASYFSLQSSTNVAGPYANVSPPAPVISLGGAGFQAVTAQNGPFKFYRIKRD